MNLWTSPVPVIVQHLDLEYCIKASRFKYLSQYITDIEDFFETKLLWFSKDEKSLQIHYPIGLLYDIAQQECLIVRMETSPPPLDYIRDSPETTFFNMLKMADFIRHQSIKQTMQLSKQDQTDLYQALLDGNQELYQKIRPQLESGPKHLPLRLYKDGQPIQQLITPDTNLSTLLDGNRCITHSIDVTDKDLQWIAKHCEYPDTFLHLVLC